MKNVEELVPEVESAFARLHAQLRNRERTLRMRVSELKAAECHIEQLEGKLLKLKQYRSELKLVKEQKKALQKSPERRIGQMLLAPYRLPERLIKVIWKKLFRRGAPMILRELADEVLRGNIDMAELSRFVSTVIPACLRSANFRNSSPPMILRELADEVLRGNIDMAELSRFVSTVIPACLRSVNFREFFPVVLHELAVMREKIDITDLSQFIATVMPHCLHSGKFRQIFPGWERHGFHVTPVHFYQPIPDTQSLPETLWTRPSELVGINMNDAGQLDLLRRHFPTFRSEYEQFPTTPAEEPGHFYLNNHLFDGMDALVAYCMVRHFQPHLLIEVGSGFSSRLLGQAATKNNNSALICIEPFPQEFLKHGFRGLHSLIENQVQDMDLDFFSQLGPGDVLFIDSSHTVKIGGDVNYLFLEVLPRLKPGVIVHVHDIFFPFDYRRDWVKEELRFWTEQYLLQAFLAFNPEFEVLIANSYMAHKYLEDLKAAFPSLEKLKAISKNSVGWGGGSFWMRRKPSLD